MNKYEGKTVSFWQFHEDGYHDNWYDMIGVVERYEPVELIETFGFNKPANMPIFRLADGSRLRYKRKSDVYMFTEDDLREQEITKDGMKYRFIGFCVHNDSETGKPEDYLYQFQNVETGMIFKLKPQIHNTAKFVDFKDFFELNPEFY
jgi:hypothetical protein